jgi:CubicO group peptidase (beta-lactamase class C family)
MSTMVGCRENRHIGYGYQWWLLPDPPNAFTAQGIYGQFVLVDPVLDLVLVKTSHWENPSNRRYEAETYALFRAIASSLRSTRPRSSGIE